MIPIQSRVNQGTNSILLVLRTSEFVVTIEPLTLTDPRYCHLMRMHLRPTLGWPGGWAGLTPALLTATLAHASAPHTSFHGAAAVPLPPPTTIASRLQRGGRVGARSLSVPGCPGWSACQETSSCRDCIHALEPFTSFLASTHRARLEQGNFVSQLLSPPCNGTAAQRRLLAAAVAEVSLGNSTSAGCARAVGVSVTRCQAEEVACATNTTCAACIGGLYAGLPSVDAGALASPECARVPPPTLDTMAFGVNTTGVGQCYTFPSCSYAKRRCGAPDRNTPGCSECWAMLSAGETHAAVATCAAGPNRTALDTLVLSCLRKVPIACGYWRARCDGVAGCSPCLAAALGASGSAAVKAFLPGGACEAIARNNTSPALPLIINSIEGCPNGVVSECRLLTLFCMINEPACAACLGGASPPNATVCAALRQAYELDEACAGCPNSVGLINRLVLATAVVGGVSAAGCLAVVLGLLAYSRDVASMKDRMLIGMFLANFIYSLANSIPLNSLRTGPADCGEFALSFETIRFGRSWWFAGKYGLVANEIVLVAASLAALFRGIHAFSAKLERGLHLVCALCGAGAFTAFYVQCAAANTAGFNHPTQTEAHTNAYSRLGATDDADDDRPSMAAAERFDAAHAQFDELQRRMLLAWLGLLGIAVVLWFVLRWRLWQLRATWRGQLAEATRQWDRDLWDVANLGERRNKELLLNMVRRGFDELATPLEGYVVIFLVFGAAAAVMASDYCFEHSAATSTATDGGISSYTVGYGTCNVACELVLSFRSLSTILLYLSWRENRRELFDLRTLGRRLWARVTAALCWPSRHGKVKFREIMLEEVHTFPLDDENEWMPKRRMSVGDINPKAFRTPYRLYAGGTPTVLSEGSGMVDTQQWLRSTASLD
eukprot:m.36717 g.36717  ORF g.36717 m.36717 type:complete len:892 (-) comp7607_c0_seq1:99-2774(-)